MPQMSPLMWGNLFILFSLLLIFSAVSIYFSNTKNISQKPEMLVISEEKQNNLSWVW